MVYYYLFGHSHPMDAAEVDSNHSKFSISINLELMNSIAATNNNELYMESLDGSYCVRRDMRQGMLIL